MDTYVLEYVIEVPNGTDVTSITDKLVQSVEEVNGLTSGDIVPYPTNKYKEFWKKLVEAFLVLRHGVA